MGKEPVKVAAALRWRCAFKVTLTYSTFGKQLGFPVVPFYRFFFFFFGGGSPNKIDYREKGTLILTSLQEDLGNLREDNTATMIMPYIAYTTAPVEPLKPSC